MDCEGTKWHRNITKILTGWVRRTNVTDDRQTTDGRAIAYGEREREKKLCVRVCGCVCTIVILKQFYII